MWKESHRACLLSGWSQFRTHMSAYKLQKSIEMGNSGNDGAAKGFPGKMRRDGCGRSAGGMSLELAKRVRKVFEGGLRGEVAGIVLGVP